MDMGGSGTCAMSGLLARLVDDAVLFPPASLSMTAAVARHRDDLAAQSPMLTDRLLCPAARLHELLAELRGADRFRVVLIAGTRLDAVTESVRVVATAPAIELDSLEVPLSASKAVDPGQAVGEIVETVRCISEPTGVPVYLEARSVDQVPAMVRAIAGLSSCGTVGAKIRCGGIRPELFPAAPALARALGSAVAAGVPIKATAGLHRAVRHVDPATGFTHFGFLNLLLAVTAFVRGGGPAEAVAALEAAGAGDVARQARGLDPETASAVRSAFVAYGSCSTRRPVREAAAMGLLVEQQRAR
ncbi:hypothetical protein ACVGVM_08200 [Pseudonocardia bannensis]|uniref:HpcH/HpaI aldolase/citrate lyase domain-containing protein n=1 Tax=Pseudonocardia bannensis TaxID=630973 RepID=A0A848DCR7_9PSEU|nr:hypothetical protein [Pseudonocardia bannensis]NMH90390.1 hypothetical protein [Pseudonocardia bannensis]